MAVALRCRFLTDSDTSWCRFIHMVHKDNRRAEVRSVGMGIPRRDLVAYRYLPRDAQALPQTCFLILDKGNRLIECCSWWLNLALCLLDSFLGKICHQRTKMIPNYTIELSSLRMRKLLPSTVSCQATRSRGRESLCPGGQPQMSIVRLNDTPIQSQKMDSFCGRINISYNIMIVNDETQWESTATWHHHTIDMQQKV